MDITMFPHGEKFDISGYISKKGVNKDQEVWYVALKLRHSQGEICFIFDEVDEIRTFANRIFHVVNHKLEE